MIRLTFKHVIAVKKKIKKYLLTQLRKKPFLTSIRFQTHVWNHLVIGCPECVSKVICKKFQSKAIRATTQTRHNKWKQQNEHERLTNQWAPDQVYLLFVCLTLSFYVPVATVAGEGLQNDGFSRDTYHLWAVSDLFLLLHLLRHAQARGTFDVFLRGSRGRGTP